MADDTLKYAIAGLGELADLYTKSKALDLAQQQFLVQREDRIADRELRVQERADQRTFQKEMFEEQKAFQILTREDTQAFQEEQAGLALKSREKQGQLSVLLNNLNSLKAEQRASEKEYEKLYKVNPVYTTSGSREITDVLSKGADGLISMTSQQIDDVYQNLADIDRQGMALRKQWTAYEDVSAEIAGLNEVVQMHEFQKWRDKEIAEGGLFEGQTELPGARAAFKSEFANPAERSRRINIITRQKKAEADALAEPLYTTIAGTLTANLGDDPDDWKEAFPTTSKIALGAFSNPNFEDFMYTYNNAPQEFRNELAAQSGLNEQLGHLIAHANSIRSLQLEGSGWSPDSSATQETFDYETAMNKIKALDVTSATKEELFRFHKQNVPAYASKDQHQALFSEIEGILHSRGETGDFGTEYVNWINTGKITGKDDKKKSNVYSGQKDRFGKTGVGWSDKRAGDYLWDSDLKLIYRIQPTGGILGRGEDSWDWTKSAFGLRGYEKEYYIKPKGSKYRKWVSRAEAIEAYPKLGISLQSFEGIPPSAARLPMSQTERDYMLRESPKEIREIEDEELEGWGRNPFVRVEQTEADLAEEQRLLDSLSAIRTWDDVLRESKEGDEIYSSFIDSSYKAIDDSLTKLGDDIEGREMFGRAWDDPGVVDPDYTSDVPGRSNYLDAQAFENLTGINPIWKFDK
jgi:hypothetical protein